MDLILTIHYVMNAILECFTNQYIRDIQNYCNTRDFPVVNSLASLIHIYIIVPNLHSDQVLNEHLKFSFTKSKII